MSVEEDVEEVVVLDARQAEQGVDPDLAQRIDDEVRDGVLGAVGHAVHRRVAPLTYPYGDSPEQFATLALPATPGPHPVVVLIHGGFWRAAYGLDLMEPLVADLVGRGYAAWNIEYRRVGQPGGGWPGTLEDVAAAIDKLADVADDADLDLDRVSVVGHSAGGHLALGRRPWRCSIRGVPGADPVVEVAAAVGLAPVTNLRMGAAERVGNGAVVDFLGGSPEEFPDRYAVAEPNLAGGARTPSSRATRMTSCRNSSPGPTGRASTTGDVRARSPVPTTST